jgi:hypothetical protein
MLIEIYPLMLWGLGGGGESCRGTYSRCLRSHKNAIKDKNMGPHLDFLTSPSTALERICPKTSKSFNYRASINVTFTEVSEVDSFLSNYVVCRFRLCNF